MSFANPSRAARRGRVPPPRRSAILLATGLALAACPGCGAGVGAGSEPPAKRETWGFTAFWDSASARSVARYGASLDAVVTTWITLDTAGGRPQALHLDSAPRVRSTQSRLALVTSYLHPEFRPVSVRRLAADPRALARASGAIAAIMDAGQHRGVVLDFEAHAPADLPSLLAVIESIADTVHARALGPVVAAIPATDTLGYPGRAILEAGADLVLPMLYDQHWAGGEPGPIAEPRWVEMALRVRVGEVGADRIVAGLPLYGYRWPAEGAGTTVSFPDAGRWNGAAVALARDSATGFLTGPLPGGGEVWVTDAELLGRLIDVVERQGVFRVALWYVGQEDPAIWQKIVPSRDQASPR